MPKGLRQWPEYTTDRVPGSQGKHCRGPGPPFGPSGVVEEQRGSGSSVCVAQPPSAVRFLSN